MIVTRLTEREVKKYSLMNRYFLGLFVALLLFVGNIGFMMLFAIGISQIIAFGFMGAMFVFPIALLVYIVPRDSVKLWKQICMLENEIKERIDLFPHEDVIEFNFKNELLEILPDTSDVAVKKLRTSCDKLRALLWLCNKILNFRELYIKHITQVGPSLQLALVGWRERFGYEADSAVAEIEREVQDILSHQANLDMCSHAQLREMRERVTAFHREFMAIASGATEYY